MKYIKRISAVFLAMIMIVTSLSANVMFAFANSNSTADIKVQQSWGKPGTSVEVNVEIENNPGISSFIAHCSTSFELTHKPLS